ILRGFAGLHWRVSQDATQKKFPDIRFLAMAGVMTQSVSNSSAPSFKPRILTGDTPTGKLHLGHWVGSVENRVALQDDYDCFFIIANKHAFTTRADKPDDIRQSVIDIAT